MCGIVGALSWGNFAIEETYIIKMRDAMIHRGPDGAGVWVSKDRRIGLGHRRLSIIDLSDAASQPMATADKRFWLVFNGEIYNHAAIRQELENLGYHQWQTDHSDTEVILYAFAEWGIDCVEKFRGMFAFGLWDNEKKELWLVRDRIGVKPLYYTFHHQRLIFASEIRALLQDPQQHRAVDEDAFFHYLSFLVSPAPKTLFEGIYKLPPGTWLKIDSNGNFLQKKYWEVWDNTNPLIDKSEEEIAHLIIKELRTAVKLRKISDVPIGIFLSGGIDSSTNAALFSEGENMPIKTFTIGYHGEHKSYQNELHYARMMSQKVGAQHHEYLLTENDLIEFLPKLIQLQDEPIADPVCFPVFYVAKLARDNGVTVVQVGEGSDELFWGYETWKTKLNLQRYINIPGSIFLRAPAFAALKLANRQHRFEYEYLRRSFKNQPIFWGGEALPETLKYGLLSPRLKKKYAGYSSWSIIEPVWKRFKDKAWDQSILHWMSYQDLNLRLPELLLARIDKMTMGVSLEGRVPFLDHKFVELALSIPTSLKIQNNNLKYILKRGVRGLIPDPIIDRPKQGFGVPIVEWFSTKLGAYIKKELGELIRKTDYLDPKWLEKCSEPKFWILFNFALWHKINIEQSPLSL